MRSIIVMAMFLASFASAAASDYTETRKLNVAVGDADLLFVNAGSGTLDVTGVDGLDSVEVNATIVIPDTDTEKGRNIVAKDLQLSLERDGDTIELKSWFEQRFWGSGANGGIDIEVRAPMNIALTIDDGSGSLDVSNFTADVKIDDGSGTIDVHGVASVAIDDGSGSIDVGNATGDVYIEDGSGSITVEKVGGTVRIDDGSGSIHVRDVANDLIILDDGSGGVHYSDVQGVVKMDD